MLRFITGLDPAARREALYSKIADCGGPVVLIVPEQYSFESERLLGRRLGRATDEAAEVLSFSRLCDRIFREYGGLAGDHVDDAAKLLLMSAALSQASDELKYYTKKSHGPAFVEKLLRADSEICNAGASPGELARVADEAPEGALKAKAADLALVFSVYHALLDRGFLDPLEDISRAVAVLSGHDFFAGRHVFIDGFTGFTGSEYRMLGVILEQAPEVTLSLCCDTIFDASGGCALFSKPAKTASRLILLAKRAGVRVESPVSVPPSGYWRSPALLHLAENFLRAGAAACAGEPDGSVNVVSASGPYDEARWIAAQCRELAAGGMRWREMTVIARDLSLYEHELPAAFAREGIPYFMDRREDISSLPPAAYLSAALEACRTNLSPAAVFRMLKTGVAPFTAEETAALENYCFVWNIRGALWASPFTGNPSGFGAFSPDDEAELARVNELRERVVTPLLRLKDGLSRADGKRFSESLFAFIEESGALEGLKKLAEKYDEAGDTRGANELDALWSCIVAALDRFSETLTGVVLPEDAMARLFELTLTAADLGSLPQTLDCVLVGSADRMRPLEPRAVFVCGVSEGVFPMPPASGALFTDPDRETMAALGLELADTADDELLAERLFAYSAFTAAREKLYVSYPRCGVSGEEAPPSVLVGQCLSLFPGLKATETAAFAPGFYLHGAATAFELLSSCGGATPFSEALRSSLLGLPEWRERVGRLERPVLSASFRLEDRAVAERLFGADSRLFPSGIECFHSCRFMYFAQYGLRLKERRAAGLNPVETGDLIHEALFRVISKYGAKGLCALSKEELSAEADAILSDCLAAAVGEGGSSSRRFAYLYGRLSSFLLRLLQRLAAEFRVSGFEPAAFEQPLREGGEVEPYRFVTPDGRNILVGGRIDRIDILKKNGKKYARVIDYKSGAKEFALSDVYYGLNLQMLIYLFAVWQGGKGALSGCLPAGILYMPAKDAVLTAPRDTSPEDAEKLKLEQFRMNGLLLDDEDVLSAMEPGLGGVFIPVKAQKSGYSTSSLATLAEIGAIRGHIEKLLCDMSDELLRGEIGAVPSDSAGKLPCAYCRYADVCRRPADGASRPVLAMKKEEFYHAIKEADGDA